MKRNLNNFIKRTNPFCPTPKVAAYKKRSFVPFVDERDHLGQLIESDIQTELGNSYNITRTILKQGN